MASTCPLWTPRLTRPVCGRTLLVGNTRGPDMTDVKILATGLGFPEGPVALADGSVILTEIRNGRCSRVSSDGKVSVFSKCGGGPNGLAIGPDGAYYLCNNGGSR